ncbi:unnamed protein product [Musa banksii]
MCPYRPLCSFPSREASVLLGSLPCQLDLLLQVLLDGDHSIWGYSGNADPSLVDAAGLMGRNGGAQETQLLTRSTVSGHINRAAIAQESMWKVKKLAMPRKQCPSSHRRSQLQLF